MYPPEKAEHAFVYFIDDREPDNPALYIALVNVTNDWPNYVHQVRRDLGWRNNELLTRVLFDLRLEREIEDHNILDEQEARAVAERFGVDLDEPKPAILRAFQKQNGYPPRLVNVHGPLLARRDAARGRGRT
jgi:hypothetical protein